ncbi:hypothetical protein [Fodinicola acaciae]|uniref:hypothetical protein n=1 Tax=Fodinicola acaciae TaxID=2681555 RepID=UPI0013D18474|nr:hypothetical protein [Fodinicola acaciae]
MAEPDRRLRITERLDGRVVIAGSIDQETALQLDAARRLCCDAQIIPVSPGR